MKLTHIPFEGFNHQGLAYSNTGTLFDEDTYYPIIRKISAEAFDAYKARKAPVTPLTMETKSEIRAASRVEHYLEHSQEQLQ